MTVTPDISCPKNLNTAKLKTFNITRRTPSNQTVPCEQHDNGGEEDSGVRGRSREDMGM